MKPEFETRWRIDPHFLGQRTEYAGTTKFSEAMGGKGTRLTFEVDLAQVDESKGIGSIMSSIIQRNFRELVEAAEKLAGDE